MELGPLTPIDDVEAYGTYMRHWTELQTRPPMQTFSVTAQQATAALSAMTCRTHHADVVPVELAATSEIVAWLCVDCDKQLPAEWKTSP